MKVRGIISTVIHDLKSVGKDKASKTAPMSSAQARTQEAAQISLKSIQEEGKRISDFLHKVQTEVISQEDQAKTNLQKAQADFQEPVDVLDRINRVLLGEKAVILKPVFDAELKAELAKLEADLDDELPRSASDLAIAQLEAELDSTPTGLQSDTTSDLEEELAKLEALVAAESDDETQMPRSASNLAIAQLEAELDSTPTGSQSDTTSDLEEELAKLEALVAAESDDKTQMPRSESATAFDADLNNSLEHLAETTGIPHN